MSLPRLCNQYAALQESFQWPFDAPVNVLRIPFGTGMNQIQGFEPGFTANNLISGSPLATAMFARYEEFRVRKIMVTFTSSVLNVQNTPRSDAWIYWVPNHANFDSEGGVGQYTDVTDISEAARFQHVTTCPGRSFKVEYVPQVVFQQSVTVGGVPSDQSGDGKMPWVKCSAANRDTLLLRGPVVYFRRGFFVGQNVPIIENDFQVLVCAVIEFRNLNDDN